MRLDLLAGFGPAGEAMCWTGDRPGFMADLRDRLQALRAGRRSGGDEVFASAASAGRRARRPTFRRS